MRGELAQGFKESQLARAGVLLVYYPELQGSTVHLQGRSYLAPPHAVEFLRKEIQAFVSGVVSGLN